MSVLVVDANIAVRWFVAEPGRDQAVALLGEEFWLIAPDLLLVEVSNVLRRKVCAGEIDLEQAEFALEAVPTLIDALYPDSSVAHRGLALGVAFDHPTYDCIYLALAELHDAQLATGTASFWRHSETIPCGTASGC